MKVFKGTYFKALLLFLVFSMNTLVSFACSFGGYFHSIHHHNSPAKTTENGDSEHKHHHSGHQHGHDHGKPSHSHSHTTPVEQEEEKSKDDCCSSSVIQVEKMEKAPSRSIEAPQAVFLASFIQSYSYLFFLLPQEEKIIFPSLFRWRLPGTIQDLRIVIQSFQI